MTRKSWAPAFAGVTREGLATRAWAAARAQTKAPLDVVIQTTTNDRDPLYITDGLTPAKLTEVLKEADAGEMARLVSLYAEMVRKDPRLFSAFQTRVLAVVNLPLAVKPGDEDDPRSIELAQDATRLFGGVEKLRAALTRLLGGIFYGYACEAIPGGARGAGGGYAVDRLAYVPRSRVLFKNSIVPRLKRDANDRDGVELEPYRFAWLTYDLVSAWPNQSGLLRVLAWTYLFKRFSLADWVIFGERFGMPPRWLTYRPGLDKEQRDKLFTALKRMGTDNAAMFPEGVKLEFGQLFSGQGAATVYELLIEHFNKDYAIAILGQSLTTDSNKATGSYALGAVHNQVRGDIIASDALWLAEALSQQLLKPWALWTAGEGVAPPVATFELPDTADKQALMRLTEAAVKMGARVPKRWVHERFGIPQADEADTDDDLLRAPAGEDAGGGFFGSVEKPPYPQTPFPRQGQGASKTGHECAAAERSNDIHTALEGLATRAAEKAQATLGGLYDDVKAAAEESQDWDDFMERVLALAGGGRDGTALREMVEAATVVADLYGRSIVNGEGG